MGRTAMGVIPGRLPRLYRSETDPTNAATGFRQEKSGLFWFFIPPLDIVETTRKYGFSTLPEFDHPLDWWRRFFMTEGHAAESKDCLGIPSSWQHDMRRWAHAGMRLLFPAGCAFCDGEGETPPDDVPICSACRTLFLEGQGLRCPRCGARLPSDLPPEPRCPHCLKARLQFQSVLAMGVYRGELREAVLRMKELPGEPLSMAVVR